MIHLHAHAKTTHFHLQEVAGAHGHGPRAQRQLRSRHIRYVDLQQARSDTLKFSMPCQIDQPLLQCIARNASLCSSRHIDQRDKTRHRCAPL